MKSENLEEIWKSRKEIEKEYGGDLRKFFRSMKQKTAPQPYQKDEFIMGLCEEKRPYPYN